MKHNCFFLALSLAAGIFVPAARAVDLNVVSDSGTSGVTFAVSSEASTAGCVVEIFGSDRKDELGTSRKGRFRVARGVGSGGTIFFRATKLPVVRQIGGSTQEFRGYFKAALSCQSTKRESTIRSAIFKASNSGTEFGLWLTALRQRTKISDFQLQDALPGLTFTRPLDVRTTPGSKRLLVVEQIGSIWAVQTDTPTLTKELFLDITSKTRAVGERGLIGLALHPNFEENGYFYVNYNDVPEGNSIIARYTASGTPRVASAESEVVLLKINQRFPNHKGGALAFGPDGYLYIGLGDGGNSGDPERNAQNGQSYLGKILRIDVDTPDPGKLYGIPATNPFRGSATVLEEIFAIGFRNPFRFSFDFSTNQFWVGDVGQDRVEEVGLVESGKNYGWNTMEGSRCYLPTKNCAKKDLELPVAEYRHGEGYSVTGGYVYRGKKIPSLAGKYLFGDFTAGKVWTLTYDGARAKRELIFDTDYFISSFGLDGDGEILLVSYGEGRVYRILPR